MVNFVLDTSFTGLKGELRGGISKYGDNQNVDASIAYGKSFANDRGHVIASFEYYRNSG